MTADNLTGEGGLLIHGRLCLDNFDRGDLFSQELDRKLSSVVCGVCLAPSRDLTAWRHHCQTKHAALPGYGPQRISTGRGRKLEMFSAAAGRFQCPRCKRRFPTQEEMEDHRHSQMRCVRLVCGQCGGLWSDLESHLVVEHGMEDTCVTCGLAPVADLLEHYHTHHDGFASVIAETEVKCAGDGVTVEWFETVLETSARFLASEVKPEKESGCEEEVDILDTSLLYQNTPDLSVPKITSISGSVSAKPAAKPKSRAGKGVKAGQVAISTEEERDLYNADCYRQLVARQRAGEGRLGRSNNCDICGFEPYTKNKYREKQDHLTKQHFKERIDALLPLTSPYRCPDPVCGYMGKDKQDIQRHYTGKHSILKMWVDAFLREMAGEASRDEEARARAGRELTFRQMELRAIQQQQELEEDDDIAEVLEDAPPSPVERLQLAPPSPVSPVERLASSCVTISKISVAGPRPGDRGLDTPPSISLTRISRAPAPAPASALLRTVAARAAASPDLAVTSVTSTVSSSAGRGTLSFKHPCSDCDMSFPTEAARVLHLEVCRGRAASVLPPASPPPDTDTSEPPKKKKRPPPPLIPL